MLEEGPGPAPPERPVGPGRTRVARGPAQRLAPLPRPRRGVPGSGKRKLSRKQDFPASRRQRSSDERNREGVHE
eukprot:14276705-Alexandrium_andersonii.AAC.1